MSITDLKLERPDATLVGTAIGAGPPVLLLHAGGERRSVWAPAASRLAKAGFRAIAYDLRGHGESGTANAARLRAHADDVAAMIASEYERTVVVGASLGGLAALLALGRPAIRDHVAGLVLVDVIPDPPAERVRAYLNRLRDGLGERAIVTDVLGQRPTLRAVAAELTETPILLVRGGRSLLTDADALRLTKLAPHARVELIPDAGHLVAADAPRDLAKLLVRHVGAVRGGD